MKAELHVQVICPNCVHGVVLTNPPAGTWPRTASCSACGFRCQVPTVDVVPCDRYGNALPDGISTEDELIARNCTREVE